jgi:hypothetical protein
MRAEVADIHREQAKRADQLADLARRRISGANAAAERQEGLVKAADARHGELHVRAAALQRDADDRAADEHDGE